MFGTASIGIVPASQCAVHLLRRYSSPLGIPGERALPGLQENSAMTFAGLGPKLFSPGSFSFFPGKLMLSRKILHCTFP
jgi:hypothetical protein